MQNIIWDLETCGLPSDQIEAMMPDFMPDSRLKDPEKIKADIDSKKEKFIESAALNATTGEILAIGYKVESGKYEIDYQREGIRTEVDLILAFLNQLDNQNFYIGFNTHGFDLPFLIRRAWKNKINVHRKFLARYFPDNQIDLMKIWSGQNYQDKISLNALGKFFGFGGKEHTGEYYGEMFHSGRIEEANEYLRKDLELTWAVAERMGVI